MHNYNAGTLSCIYCFKHVFFSRLYSSSICDDKKAVFNFSSVDKGGPVSLTLLEQEISDVLILQLNVTQHDRWTAVIHTVKMSELGNTPRQTLFSICK